MGIAIIELNDSAIQCRYGETFLSVPGYALLSDQGLITGEQAAQQAWLLPQQSHCQYWHQLNLSPLPGANAYARHHADLAHAQLQALYRDAGQPEQVIFAIPGNMTTDQLSILLGLAKASPFNSVGLVDAAVAATCQAGVSGEVTHVDMQLHTSVLTRLSCGQDVSRHHAAQHPDISLKGFYDTWAHFIAEQFITQYRYDPMHTAQGEQELRNLLPVWLKKIHSTEEIEIELAAQQGKFKLTILREQLIAANSQRWQGLSDAIARQSGADTILISHRVAALPGAREYINYAGILAPEAAIISSLAHAQHIVSDSDKLSFITTLKTLQPHTQMTKAQTLTSTTDRSLPSHVLYRHKAYVIGKQLEVRIDNDGALRLRSPNANDQSGAEAILTINSEADRISLVEHSPSHGLVIQTTADLDALQAGDQITVDDEMLTFIEVL